MEEETVGSRKQSVLHGSVNARTYTMCDVDEPFGKLVYYIDSPNKIVSFQDLKRT